MKGTSEVCVLHWSGFCAKIW